MKVLIQTSITPVMTVYDSAAPDDPEAGALRKAAMKFLDPVVVVTNDSGAVLYKSGEFYESWFPAIAGIAGAVVAYLILRRVV